MQPEYKITLDNQDWGINVKDEPAGLNDLTIKLKRHKSYKSLIRSISTKLRFVGDGKVYIDDEFNTKGLNAIVDIEITKLNKQTTSYVSIYTGTIDFNTIKITDLFTEVSIVDSTLTMSMISRDKIKVNINNIIDVNGKNIPVLPTDNFLLSESTDISTGGFVTSNASFNLQPRTDSKYWSYDTFGTSFYREYNYSGITPSSISDLIGDDFCGPDNDKTECIFNEDYSSQVYDLAFKLAKTISLTTNSGGNGKYTAKIGYGVKGYQDSSGVFHTGNKILVEQTTVILPGETKVMTIDLSDTNYIDLEFVTLSADAPLDFFYYVRIVYTATIYPAYTPTLSYTLEDYKPVPIYEPYINVELSRNPLTSAKPPVRSYSVDDIIKRYHLILGLTGYSVGQDPKHVYMAGAAYDNLRIIYGDDARYQYNEDGKVSIVTMDYKDLISSLINISGGVLKINEQTKDISIVNENDYYNLTVTYTFEKEKITNLSKKPANHLFNNNIEFGYKTSDFELYLDKANPFNNENLVNNYKSLTNKKSIISKIRGDDLGLTELVHFNEDDYPDKNVKGVKDIFITPTYLSADGTHYKLGTSYTATYDNYKPKSNLELGIIGYNNRSMLYTNEHFIDYMDFNINNVLKEKKGYSVNEIPYNSKINNISFTDYIGVESSAVNNNKWSYYSDNDGIFYFVPFIYSFETYIDDQFINLLNSTPDTCMTFWNGTDYIDGYIYDIEFNPISKKAKVEIIEIQKRGNIGLPPITLTDFTTEWNLAAGTFTYPFIPNTAVNTWVDWGDGSALELCQRSTNETFDFTHDYATAGTYDIKVKGYFDVLIISDTRLQLIKQWGSLVITYNTTFVNSPNFDVTATDAPVVNTSILGNIFAGCTSLTNVGADWNIQTVETMHMTFMGSGLTSINLLNSYNLEKLDKTFMSCPALTSFNMSSGVKMKEMYQTFTSTSSLTSFPRIDMPLLYVSDSTFMGSGLHEFVYVEYDNLLVMDNMFDHSDLEIMNNIYTPKLLSIVKTWYGTLSLKTFSYVDMGSVTNGYKAFQSSGDTANPLAFPAVNFSSLTNGEKMFWFNRFDSIGACDFSSLINGIEMFAHSLITHVAEISFDSLLTATEFFQGAHIDTFLSFNFPKLESADYMFRKSHIRDISRLHIPNIKNLVGGFGFCDYLITTPLITRNHKSNGEVSFFALYVKSAAITTVNSIDLTGVTDTDAMFNGCTALVNMVSLDYTTIKIASFMFMDCINLTCIDGTIKSDSLLYGNLSFYNCPSLTQPPTSLFGIRSNGGDMRKNKNWTNSGGCIAPPQPKLDITVTATSTPTLYNITGGTIDTTDNGDGTYSLTSYDTITHLRFYGGSNNYTIQEISVIKGDTLLDLTNTFRALKSMTTFEWSGDCNATSMFYGWYQCSALTSFPPIDTSHVINMNHAWRNCSNLVCIGGTLDFTSVIYFADTFLSSNKLVQPASTGTPVRNGDDVISGGIWTNSGSCP